MLDFRMEHESMSALIESYFSEPKKAGFLADFLRLNASMDTAYKIDVLHYGYGARTRAVLESDFPHFLKTLELQEWIKIGSDFCLTKAFKNEYLGRISIDFYIYAQSLNLSLTQAEALNLDHGYLICSESPFQAALETQSLYDLNEESVIPLQSCVFPLKNSENFLIISRNREVFFINQVSEIVFEVLKKMSENNLTVLGLSYFFTNEAGFADFLTLGIQNFWFRKIV